MSVQLTLKNEAKIIKDFFSNVPKTPEAAFKLFVSAGIFTEQGESIPASGIRKPQIKKAEVCKVTRTK